VVISADAIQQRLDGIKRYGVRAFQLSQHGRPLVDLLVPHNPNDPTETLSKRAIKAENIIRDAIERLGGTHRLALKTLLGLAHDGITPTLEERRRQAAKILGVLPVTFRAGKHEKELLGNLAFEIYEIILSRETAEGENGASLTPSPNDAAPGEQCHTK
jgi:hypothetical protein